MKLTSVIAAVLSSAVAFTVVAQEPAEIPSFINLKANKYEMNGADVAKWQKVARDINNAVSDGRQIDILHIGDSHIQAEMGTSRLRELLQQRYGNAGRGLITAFRLAGTNQPVDYAITSEFPTDSQARLLKRPWPIKPGFTGVASLTNQYNRITFKNLKEGHKFDVARIFTSDGERSLRYPVEMDSAMFYAFPGERVFGVYTRNSHNPGLIYSTIGNNGACYSDYLLIDGFADDVARLNPQIIVLSMGTNEGYSTMTDDEIASTTRQLISNLRKANPEALMLLWTPMECHKKDDAGNYAVASRVKDARDVMLRVAREEHIPSWDFYEVAGGDGSAQHWLDTDMMNPRDHVHLLNKGYRLQGQLAYDALVSFLDSLQ